MHYPIQLRERLVFTGLLWLLTADILYLIVHRSFNYNLIVLLAEYQIIALKIKHIINFRRLVNLLFVFLTILSPLLSALNTICK